MVYEVILMTEPNYNKNLSFLSHHANMVGDVLLASGLENDLGQDAIR